MTQFFSFLPQIIFIQAVGVGLAWGADVLSWKWRREQKMTGSINVFGLFFSMFLVSLLTGAGTPVEEVAGSFGLMGAWLSLVTWVQKRQFKVSTRATFFGALMQLVCFVWALFLYFAIIISPARLTPGWSILLWLVTAVFTYALLSLFRPTIYSTWNTWRQKGKK